MASHYTNLALSTPVAFNIIPPSYVWVNNESIAYRNLSYSANNEYPVIFLNHFRGTIDTVDPLLASSIAATGRDFIALDNVGVGYSSGTVPDNVEDAADLVVGFLSALGVEKIDLLGFSLGGMIAQNIAENHPQLLNKLILSGTQSGYTEGAEYASNDTLGRAGQPGQPDEDTFLQTFFDPASNASQQAGGEWWARINDRPGLEGRDLFVGDSGSTAQYQALSTFITSPASFEALEKITIPVLVTNGDKDVITPTVNSVLLQRNISNAQLHIYPNAGHGHLYQYPEDFAKLVDLFLRSDL